ncbi:hypothetical protein ACIGFL_09305 [Pseudomonas sp. NPDC077649]|uniref:hypothetical protein n=1 Tax=Pseudomonas sp. NPDC077649 TaxID=3364423 RepID=UPI0037C59674
MQWLVPLFVFLLAFVFWRLSWRTDDRVAAWSQFSIAVLLVLLGIAVVIGMALQ